jgi:Zn finger protein HypA/HybF involved in hydrogenase expression
VTRLTCSECGDTVVARSVFETEGECPSCGAEAGSLVEEDAYDDQPHELRCADCGWDVEVGVRTEWDGTTRVYTVDDDCPVCASVGWTGVLEPVVAGAAVRAQPEHRLARGVADRTRGTHPGPPLDVDAIAVELALTVRRGPFGHDGLLRGTTIEVPSGHRGAERFVIAHEIGHHVLGHTGDRHKIEPEANAFASELLMPRSWLAAAVKEGLDLNGLARRFDVSREAVVHALRAASLLNRLGR